MEVVNDEELEHNSIKRVEAKRDHEFLAEHLETEPCTKKQAVEASGIIETVPCAKDKPEEALIDNEKEPFIKNLVKEASNEDVFSEVSNPILSPRDISSQPAEFVKNNQGGCGEVTSTCSGSSSSEETISEEELSRNDTSGEVSTSHVVLEIPKHASSTGIRKITFKFSKRKEDHDDQPSALVVPPVANRVHDGLSYSGFRPSLVVDYSNAEVVEDFQERWSSESRNPYLCSDMEIDTCMKLGHDIYPTNVKKLLSIGILEGAKVKYISTSREKELIGIVSGGGYLCGCSSCNFTNILSAYEFELHAGGKTRHPNNHIFMENGRPIYSIIEALKTAPLSTLDEVIKDVAGSSVNEEFFQVWKASLQQNKEMPKAGKNHHMKLPGMHNSTSCSGQWMEDSLRPTSYFYSQNLACKQHIFVEETAEVRKRVFKKQNSSSSVLQQKKTVDGRTKKRDNDLHRLLFLPNGLPDGTDLAYYSKGQRMLGGYKQGNGIVCNCCNTEISPSQFEAHAGLSARRQPYRNICISSGQTLHDIALSLANGQSIVTGVSDDMCAVCGDGGELINCAGCPRSFHTVCLELQCPPEGDWQCPYCKDKYGAGKKAAGDSLNNGRPIIIRLTRVVKAPEYETGGCVVCRANDFSVAKFDERTVMLCDQCEKEYHVGCLRDSGLCDLKELPEDKWFCCGDCNRIHEGLQKFVLAGAEVIPTSLLNTINKKHGEKGLTDEFANDIQWQILSGRSRHPEHLLLLSGAVSIFRECFDPIVARSGRDLIPVMVYGRNISGQEFGGMYCVVLTVRSVVVSAGLIRVFGRDVAELPLVATSRGNQGKGYFQALFSCIERLLCSLNVEHLVLPAAEEAESIWTKKLGFKKMGDERFRDFQLTVFNGTSMLEKEVQQMAD